MENGCAGARSIGPRIERGIKTMFLNIRSTVLALPAAVSPPWPRWGDDQTAIFDELKVAIDEILEEMSDPRAAFAVQTGVKRMEKKRNKDPAQGACGPCTGRAGR